MFSRYGNTNIKMIRMKNNVSYKHFLHTINFMGHICRINTLGYAILDLIKQAFLYSFVKFSGFLFLMFIYIMYFTISFYPLHCFRGRGHCTLSVRAPHSATLALPAPAPAPVGASATACNPK